MAEYECKNCKNEKTCPSKKGSHKYCFESLDVALVVHGRWTTVDGVSVCSECGYIPPYDNTIDDIFYSNYCPNCGAIMDRKDEK